jgi:flagellar biosynthetic protein FliQ
MNPQDAIDLGREAIFTALFLSAPLLIAGAVVGLVIGLIQALTQIQDQTVSFVPKIVAMVAVLGVCLPWMLQRMADYSQELINNIPRIISGG